MTTCFTLNLTGSLIPLPEEHDCGFEGQDVMITPARERITERDIDVAAEEALRADEEDDLRQMIFVDPMERDY